MMNTPVIQTLGLENFFAIVFCDFFLKKLIEGSNEGLATGFRVEIGF
jgi:hypothetical protein